MNDDDRALLEAAARAAGILLDADGDRLDQRDAGGAPLPWNPLTDDGDRYRLARATGINVEWGSGSGCASTDAGQWFMWGPGHEDDEAHAIVRAAVASGT